VVDFEKYIEKNMLKMKKKNPWLKNEGSLKNKVERLTTSKKKRMKFGLK